MSQDTSQDNGAPKLQNCEVVDFTTWLDTVDFTTWLDALDAELVATAIMPFDCTIDLPEWGNLSDELAKRERQPGRRRRRSKR